MARTAEKLSDGVQMKAARRLEQQRMDVDAPAAG